jgi:hypothetical protein
MISKKFFKRLGIKALKMYKEQIFDRATDVRGNKFRGYSTDYGEKKRAGKLLGQWAGSTGTTAPVVTQAFKNNLRFRGATANQFKIGWSSRGGIVNHLADLDRIVTEDRNPFPKDVVIEIERQVKREMQRHKDMKSKHHKIVLGK